MGGMIDFQCNGEFHRGYLAPSVSGKGAGVIVIQEYWGLVGHITNVADRFSEAGFTALAPDFYQGKIAHEPDEAGSMLMALNIADAEQLLACAAQRLQSDPATDGDKLGVVGFCMGGQLSLFAACAHPQMYGACVDFYGIHPNVHPDYASLQAPLLGFFAEHDDYAPPASVAAMDEALTALGKKHEFHTYPGTSHAFFNDDRPNYDAVASQDAWRRILTFFQEHL